MKNFFWNGKNGPLLIAEIGGNHEGNFFYAKKLTRQALKSGVDVIKFQLYSGNTLVNQKISPKRNKHFKKFELTKNQHIELAKMCVESGAQYNASIWDANMIDWVDKYLKFYKIGSGDLTAYPIIYEFAKRGKPILLSTGLSNLPEIKETINFIIKTNPKYNKKNMIALMQCTSMYPTHDTDVNLSVIPELKKIFKCEIGFSNHSVGDLALLTSYVKGANILEFHFTDTRKKKVFRDHFISLTKDEVVKLVLNLKRIKILLGKSKKKTLKSEIVSGNLKSFRRAIYFNKNISKGYVIKKEDIICLRPNEGLDARKVSVIIDKKAPKSFKAFQKIKL
jgi:N-acetylneuraminate synthase/N,N'-diacetyllegionaminate synthase